SRRCWQQRTRAAPLPPPAQMACLVPAATMRRERADRPPCFGSGFVRVSLAQAPVSVPPRPAAEPASRRAVRGAAAQAGGGGGGGGGTVAGAGVRGGGTFAGGVAQEHNAAARSAVRNSGSWRMREEPELEDRLVEASGVAMQALAPSALYVVATPIGNLADLTVRAWWVLSHVDAIAAEDTRVTRQLLERYRIEVAPARLIAAHEHNERGAAERVLALLHEGLRVALVSDAGTPAISDPGAGIVQTVRAAGLRVIPVPGASSLAAALSVAGFDQAQALFVGFLPTAARERAR